MDSNKLSNWLQVAADVGIIGGLALVAVSNESIDSGIRAFCDRQFVSAFEILRPYAEQGNADAQVILAILLDDGAEGVEKNTRESISWYRKAAEQGDGEAQTNLGLILAQGLGVKADLDEAVHWFSKASEAGFSEGQYNLAYAYTLGAGGLVKDEAKAVEFFTMAAIQGHIWAQSNLGHMYLQGVGVKIDNVQALKWLYLSSRSGDAPAKAFLDEHEASTSAEQKEEAERLVDSFVPKLTPAEQRLQRRCFGNEERSVLDSVVL